MRRKFADWAVLAASANAEFLAALFLYVLLTLLASAALNFPIHIDVLYGEVFIALGAAITIPFFCVLTARALLVDRPERPFEHVLRFWRSKFWNDWALADRLSIGLPAALMLPIFFSVFTSVKAAISHIIPFYADPFFANADRLLMGTDAWRILQPIVGFPLVTFILNFAYNIWFIAVFATLFWVAFAIGNLRLRRQFLVAFVLVLAILGNVLAVLFSSAGPCFYKVFYGAPRFADLMAYLHAANASFPISSLEAQAYLLNSEDGFHFGAGISAFPSVHVALAMLNVMLYWRLKPWGRIASLLFLVLILVGSVHLGWHYAVDGYFSIVTVPIIWWAAGKFSLGRALARLHLAKGLTGPAKDGEPFRVS